MCLQQVMDDTKFMNWSAGLLFRETLTVWRNELTENLGNRSSMKEDDRGKFTCFPNGRKEKFQVSISLLDGTVGYRILWCLKKKCDDVWSNLKPGRELEARKGSALLFGGPPPLPGYATILNNRQLRNIIETLVWSLWWLAGRLVEIAKAERFCVQCSPFFNIRSSFIFLQNCLVFYTPSNLQWMRR